MLILDAVLLTLAIVGAAWGRANMPGFGFAEDRVQEITYRSVRLTGVQVLVGWIIIIAAFGGYTRRNIASGARQISRILRASLVAAAGIGISCYLAKYSLSRGFFVLLFMLGIPALVIGRVLVRRLISKMHQRGLWATRVLVAGTPTTIDDVAKVLARETSLGYTVVGAVTPLALGRADTPLGHPVAGHTEEIIDLVQRHRAAAVIFAAGAFPSAMDYRRVAWELATQDVEMIVVPALTDVASERIRVQPMAGVPFVFVDPPERGSFDQVLKRAFDIVGASVAVLLASPFMLLAAVQIKLHDRGLVFFAQERIGRHGRSFQCLKFRSMITNADGALSDIRHLDEGAGVLFKMNDDPRVTPPGKWLRRYSLDELPQLFNVLRGEMSLVGPRPPLPREVADYHVDVHRRLNVRPGLTGLWQVSGRSDLSWDDTVRLDLYYVDNWSILQDLVILARTVRAVVSGRGAY